MPDTIITDYFYGDESQQFQYFRIPRLLSGYRRRVASERAGKKDIPAFVYEMTMQEAIAYRKAVKDNPKSPIPGKHVDPAEKNKDAEKPAVEQKPEAPAAAAKPEKDDDITKGPQERPEVTKVILTGDRLRKYFPNVEMTPREIEESIYSALEERRQRQIKEQQKAAIFKKSTGPSR